VKTGRRVEALLLRSGEDVGGTASCRPNQDLPRKESGPANTYSHFDYKLHFFSYIRKEAVKKPWTNPPTKAGPFQGIGV
jgi:hypothetical protein